MSRYAVLAGVLTWCTCAPRAVAAPAAGGAGPRIGVDAADFSFGRVPNDRAVEHVFKVSNTGTKPLVITRVQTSCGCTAAMMESSVIDPGKSGKLRVQFNPKGQKQIVTRTVTIHSNDEAQPALALRVSAEVVPVGEEKKPAKAPRRAHPPEPRLTFAGACLKCHGPRTAGESGGKLYLSACAPCHGPSGEGVRLGDAEVIGPPLRLASMTVKSPAGLRQVVAAGTGHPFMPGFGREYGGPLTDAQVASVVDHILKAIPAR